VETVTSGEAVTMRRAKSLSARPISLRMAPKPVCVEFLSLEPPLAARSEWHGVEEFLQARGRQREALELVPFVAGAHRHRLAEGFHLRRRH
jgi:hypothetical protein